MCSSDLAFTRLPPSSLERFEALEQLRALSYGFRISVMIVDHPPLPGVDTPEDAKRMQGAFAAEADRRGEG